MFLTGLVSGSEIILADLELICYNYQIFIIIKFCLHCEQHSLHNSLVQQFYILTTVGGPLRFRWQNAYFAHSCMTADTCSVQSAYRYAVHGTVRRQLRRQACKLNEDGMTKHRSSLPHGHNGSASRTKRPISRHLSPQ